MTYAMGAAEQPAITLEQLKSAADRQGKLIERFKQLPEVRDLLADPSFSEQAFKAALGTLYDVAKAAASGAKELGVPVPVPGDQVRALVKGTLLKIKKNLRQVVDFTASPAARLPEMRQLHGRLLLVNNKMLSNLQRLVRDASPANGTSGLGFLGIVLFVIQVSILVALWDAIFESDEEVRKRVDKRCAELAKQGTPCDAKDIKRLMDTYGGKSWLEELLGEDIQKKLPDGSDITKGAGEGIKWGIIIASVGVLGALTYMVWPYMTGARQVGERFTEE